MRTINKNESAEIVIKKSKFIANIFRVNSEEEAKSIKTQLQKLIRQNFILKKKL